MRKRPKIGRRTSRPRSVRRSMAAFSRLYCKFMCKTHKNVLYVEVRIVERCGYDRNRQMFSAMRDCAFAHQMHALAQRITPQFTSIHSQIMHIYFLNTYVHLEIYCAAAVLLYLRAQHCHCTLTSPSRFRTSQSLSVLPHSII
jgi:hypothetical protein